ncbi:MAG: hypothetical protein U9R34_06160 [Nanoarchaeota archaeon]|nr:hypothetical protein [Nanoarchaeota archaeon]
MNKKLIDGIPFTLDSKEMIEKSISNLSLDPYQYLKEITRFAFANNASRIDIINKKDITEVNFDGSGIASKDDLKSLLMNIYNSDENGGINNLGMLGRSVVASLKTKPLEVIIKTHDNHSNYIMKIDSKLDQKLFTIDKPGTRNSFTIVKSKRKHINPLEATVKSYNYAKTTSVSGSLGDIFGKTLDWANYARSHFQNYTPDLDKVLNSETTIKKQEIVNKLKAICWFSEIPVYLNKEKINQGFTFPDTVYECKYEFDKDINILISMPRGNHLNSYKKTIYLRNSAFLSLFQGHNREFISSQLAMDIAVDAPEIKMNMSGDQILHDDYFNSLNRKVNIARDMFYQDILKNMSRIEPHGKYELRNFITVFLHQNMSWKDHGSLKQTKLFSDIDGNEYTISEVSDILKKQDAKLYTTMKTLRKNHPLLNDKKKVIISLESDIEANLIEKLFGFNSDIIRIDERIKKYNSENQEQKLESLIKISRKATKGTAYAALSSAVLAGSYFGTIFIAPYVIEHWHYGAIATSGAVGICAGVSGVKAVSKKISENDSKVLEQPWIKKCLESYGRVYNRLSDIFSKKILKKTKTEKKISDKISENLDTSTQEYILALKKLILSNDKLSEFGPYFKNIIEIKVKDKGFLSPLFSLKYSNSYAHKDYRRLVINTKKKDLYKKSRLYEKSRLVIYYDILEISNILKDKLLHMSSVDIEKDVLNAVHLSYLEDTIDSFSKGEDSFKQHFPLLSETERNGIIKKILSKEITASNEFEEWMIKNYNSELESVSKESMAGNNSKKILSYLEKSMHSIAEYEYDSLLIREKLDLITITKEMINSESSIDNMTRLHAFMQYIMVKDDIIYDYHKLIYSAKSDEIKNNMEVINEEFGNYLNFEGFFVELNKGFKLTCEENIGRYSISRLFREPKHEYSALLQIAKEYLPEQKYLQLKGIAGLLEKRSENKKYFRTIRKEAAENE